MVSSVAVGRDDVIYLLQRGTQADPVIAVDTHARVLRSWGKGLYTIPHSIRIDPACRDTGEYTVTETLWRRAGK